MTISAPQPHLAEKKNRLVSELEEKNERLMRSLIAPEIIHDEAKGKVVGAVLIGSVIERDGSRTGKIFFLRNRVPQGSKRNRTIVMDSLLSRAVHALHQRGITEIKSRGIVGKGQIPALKRTGFETTKTRKLGILHIGSDMKLKSKIHLVRPH
jgi:hypothetical protein